MSAGDLFWGSRLLAYGVTSVAFRHYGPGGPAVLYTTQQDLLYTVFCSQLPAYRHQQVCIPLLSA